MKKFLAIIFSLLSVFAGWFGVSYACKGVAKSWVDTWKGNVQVEEPEEPGDVVTPEEPEHVHAYVDVVTAPTCTEQGFTTKTCDCGDVIVDTYVNALGHSFTNYASDENATCTENGTKTAKCDNCDVTDTVVIENSALGHRLVWHVDVEETYEENGVKHEKCLVCDYVQNENTLIDKIYNPEHIELENNLLLGFTGDVDYNGSDCVYTDGNGRTADEYVEIGHISETLDTTINASIRYTTVYRESDGSFTLNNNGMVLQDANGNNLSLNGSDWISLNYATPGFMIYDENRDLYKVMLRLYPNNQGSALKYSLDVATMNGRYRLVSTQINELCEDFLECGYLDIDFGVVNNYPADYSYTYAFRFATANKEVTYVSDNSGTIKNNDEWFICEHVNSTSGEATNVKNVLGWIEETGVFNSPSNYVLYALKGNSFYASVYSKDNTGSLLTAKKGSDWFINTIKPIVWERSYKTE